MKVAVGHALAAIFYIGQLCPGLFTDLIINALFHVLNPDLDSQLSSLVDLSGIKTQRHDEVDCHAMMDVVPNLIRWVPQCGKGGLERIQAI